jgi:hypothetical protein
VPGLFSGVKRQGVVLTTDPYLAPRLKKEYGYAWAFMACSGGELCLFTLLEYHVGTVYML